MESKQEENKEQENQDEQFDEKIEEVQTVKAKTAKEMKAMCRPEFQKNPQNYYPTKVFSQYNYTRALCKCGNYYWRRTEKRDTCGDSNCVGQYTFIGKGCGVGLKGKKMSYTDAWQSYVNTFSKQRIPSVAIDRYPIVARWRNDVDFVAAGIFCFQPYCVTGELEPPANPLIQPQFCVRFNDLDNIGLTGRHYSGFVMMGNQVFNYPDKYVYFDEEVVEFHLNWLLDLEIDLDEVTLIEDVWSGGGNLGSSIEMFCHGLEVGNMVFTKFKYFPDGSMEELDIKIIDVGVGLERIPWLINGTATSYIEIFPKSLEYLQSKIALNMHSDIWEKLGPYSCLLNIDEVNDIEQTWKLISEKIDVPVDKVKEGIILVKDLYIVLDHTRTILMAIVDGSLPSNVGGGCNIRNVLRRVFAILKKNEWWDKIGGLEGFLELFEFQKEDLSGLYGQFAPYKSFNNIIQMEYERWSTTDEKSKQKLDRLLKKNKVLTKDDWMVAVTSYGIPADQPIPGDLYYYISSQQEKVAKCQEAILYNTSHLKETENLYYNDHKQEFFEARIQQIFANIKDKYKKNIVILDQSIFYPTSGGQLNDTGFLTIDGKEYEVKDCEKVGKVVLHILTEELPGELESYVGKSVKGRIDMERRSILRNHHTGTHIVFASCRQVLGPHVWQNGAKKTTENAHLDITHYSSLTREQEMEIENCANSIIMKNRQINKGFVNKATAEKEHGFRLYQGGIVPGNTLRVVNIDQTDVEACCGTHCDFTSEVGWIKMVKSTRIQDGIVRLYYVAGSKSIPKLNQQTQIINDISKVFRCTDTQLVDVATKKIDALKKLEVEVVEQKRTVLDLRMRLLATETDQKIFVKVKETEPTFYFGMMPNYIKLQKDSDKGILIIGKGDPETKQRFLYGQFGSSKLFDHQQLLKLLKEDCPNAKFRKEEKKLGFKDGKKKVQVDDVCMFVYFDIVNEEKLLKFLGELNFVEKVF